MREKGKSWAVGGVLLVRLGADQDDGPWFGDWPSGSMRAQVNSCVWIEVLELEGKLPERRERIEM